jgi:hypothetical protein
VEQRVAPGGTKHSSIGAITVCEAITNAFIKVAKWWLPKISYGKREATEAVSLQGGARIVFR